MRASRVFILGIAIAIAGSLLGAAAKPPSSKPPPSDTAAELAVREIHYDTRLSDARALFTVDIDAEATGRGEASAVLFEGDVAVLPAKFPGGLRLVREGRQYRLIAARPGQYQLKLELIVRIIRAEPWDTVTFTGPAAGIATVAAQAGGDGVEIQLLSGTPLEPEPGRPGRVAGVLGSDRAVALRWQGRTTEAARKAITTCETFATAQVSPTVIKFTTEFHYQIVQGSLPRLVVALPASHALTRVEGGQIRDWQVQPASQAPPAGPAPGPDAPPAAAAAGPDTQLLVIELIKPVEKSYALKISSEQTVEGTPFVGALNLPQPQGVDRETGSLTLVAEDTVVETRSLAGLRQVNAPAGAQAAYRFYGRPLSLDVALRRIDPVLRVAARVTARLEEARLLVSHALTLNVERAGIYSLELSPVGNFVVTDVRGEGVEDWKTTEGRLIVSFSTRVLGERRLDIQLEQSLATFPDRVALAPLRVAGAAVQTAQIGAASAPGISLKTAELNGLREIPAGNLDHRTDELLAYVTDQPDWALKLSAEKPAARVVADVFNLVTLGDGLVGGSATIRYVIVNQGVQEFRLRVPAGWKNLDFTGPNIRRKETAAAADTNSVLWTIGLQDKAWGGYTLVVTYDQPFDPHRAMLALGGIHALDVERETGSLAVTSAANLQLREVRAGKPLQRIDEADLARTDRDLITRSVLLAYRYGSGEPYDLSVETTRFPEEKILDAVADRTQLTTVVTEVGEMLTQASFMVKNNDKQFQKFTLPRGARFWSAYVNGQPAKAEADGDALLLPLPRQANRDQSFAVEIVYAQKVDPLKSLTPRSIELAAPQTDVQTTFAEWELYVPAAHQLTRFGGNMSVARGTTYGWRDAWLEFTTTYQEFWRSAKGWLALLVLAGAAAALVVAAVRRGWHGALTALMVIAVGAVLSGMLLPSLAKAKTKAMRIAAFNNLKQIGLAARLYSSDHSNRFPAYFEQMHNELGTDKVLVDPVSGRRFVWIGAGRTDGNPAAVIAFSPVDVDGRTVLFADGSVSQLSAREFEEALQRGGVAPAQLAALLAGPQAANPAPAAAPGPITAAAPGALAGGGAAPVPSVDPPAFGGLRALRIELPRSGHRFTFTKVLKLGGEPLTIRATAVTTRVLHAVRSAGQAGVFLAGLFLLWWQLSRPAPRSLLVTFALAMILGSVGHLLLTTRLLGTVIVIAVPMLAVTLAVLLARRQRLQRRESPGPEPAGPSPAPSSGLGPATAALALLLSLASARAADPAPQTATQPAAGAVRPAPVPVSILSATYTGAVHEHIARVEAVIQVAAQAGPRTVPLFGEDVAVEEFSATPAAARLVRQGNTVSVRLPAGRESVLRVKFLVRLAGDVTRRGLAFAIPAALSSRLSLTVDEPEAAVEFPTAVAYHSVDSGQQTRVEAVIGAGERVDLQWTPRVKRAAEIAATVFCQNASLAVFTGGALSLRSQLDYQVTQGELREARIRLPAGHRLLRVEGEFIRTWQVKRGGDRPPGSPAISLPADGHPPAIASRDPSGVRDADADPARDAEQILVVELTRGVSPGYRLFIETERGIDRLPGTFALDTPHALDVKRETGFIALAGSDELGLSVDGSRGLQKVDAAEFLRVMKQEKPPAGAYQFLKPEFDLAVRVAPLQPQIEAIVRNRVRIGSEQVHLEAAVDYIIRRAGVFALRLALPGDFRVESVSPDPGQVQSPDARPATPPVSWAERNEDGRRVLEVALPQRTLGAYALRLRLVRSQKELPPTVDVAGVHPLDTAKLSGYVVVLGEVGVQVRTATLEGLTEVPITSAAGGGAGASPGNGPAAGAAIVPPAGGPVAGGGLAFKFLAADPVAAVPPWKLTVTTEAIDSWVRAEVVNWLTLTETLATGRAVVRYDIQNAPVKEFRLRIPAAFKNIEISGPNIRRLDHNAEDWRVELQNKVVGPFVLTVTWDQPWSAGEQEKDSQFEAVGVTAIGVERETGTIALMARSQLQITAKSASAELIPADAQEIPDWAGRADESIVLVYRYLRPGYTLALTARRFAPAETLQALVDEARLTTVVADDGQMMTELALSVRNNGRQFLEVTLPEGAQVWSAFVAGQAVRPGVRAGKLLLPLERAADLPIPVELIYVSAGAFPRTRGPVDLASPGLDVPVKNTRWELYLPPDYSYGNFGGTMTREPDAAPVVRTFSALEYREAEQEKKKERELALSSSRDEVRRQLSDGKLGEASKAYNLLQRYRSAAESDELKALDKDLRKAQSGNLVLAQQEVMNNNASLLNQARAPAGRGSMALLDAQVAELQWDKLQRAQEIASAAARPLRVNLPARGLRHSFAQVLQTEVGKPMQIRFSASNDKVASWPLRLGGLLAGFLGLWAAVSWILETRKP